MSDREKSVHEGTSEEGIVNEVWRRAQGNGLDREFVGYQMEVLRRNNVALRAFNASSDRWARRLFWVTVALVVLTVVLIAVAIETGYLAWVLLERGG